MENIEGIQNLDYLRKLDIRNNKIRNLKPILELESLRQTRVSGNPVTDTAVLVKHTGYNSARFDTKKGLTVCCKSFNNNE